MIERESLVIENLVVMAKHSVWASNKNVEQPFNFDVQVFFDYKQAAEDDAYDKTISYCDIADYIIDFTLHGTFDLMEKLSISIAKGLMEKFPAIDEIHLKARKTKAKVDFSVDALGCTVILKREIAYLTLECSLGNRERYLNQAIDHLRSIREIHVLKVSNFIETESDNGAPALTCAVKIATYLEPEEFLNDVLAVEKALYKVDEDCGDECKICDINVVLFGNKKIHTERLQIPNKNLCNEPHIKSLLKNLEPALEI